MSEVLRWLEWLPDRWRQRYGSEADCLREFARLRWGQLQPQSGTDWEGTRYRPQYRCPSCGRSEWRSLSPNAPDTWDHFTRKCNGCGHEVSLTAKTPLEGLSLGTKDVDRMMKLFEAIRLVLRGATAADMAKGLGCAYKTALRLRKTLEPMLDKRQRGWESNFALSLDRSWRSRLDTL